LVHTINASASAAEVRPIFESLSQHRTVYAIDLPGYGFSERADRLYTPRLMTDAIHDLVRHIQAIHGSQAIDALAVSLSCEFLARAAAEQPTHFGIAQGTWLGAFDFQITHSTQSDSVFFKQDLGFAQH
jgi:pimeloyl-ACP methyl ester carboxylesterase